ncbi:Major facilitator superfamily domain, general substrate transporter [Penicillium expansum]|uniref:Major facilitator superfamily domain, general substrate transporter n=1 Tax=Penicillium expansum TaxID=27334 RepID=A0A0A2KSN2_PENEN|nr:Major facilitator superfamily domain, general substrate transporter [Penicillium expansum]KGO38449.1 Major facilitator superfamily domain, general substrate transporter [Penicillium expansum]KGO54179.1 Major facilitator superfamily domain, general substrate transporter [Penicillium expansum]KGO70754.1 Major facilitator superfamily domain, general substrate transporter [Penicillium expansum]
MTPNNTGDMDDVLPKEQAMHVEDNSRPEISREHREYLLQHHGTLKLNPLPSDDRADPLNWPSRKKHTTLLLVAFHSFMANFIGAGVIPAYDTFADIFDVSVQDASYYTSVVILFTGITPLFWKPLSDRFGRRPVWLVSTLGALICNVGCAKCTSYGTMMLCRILTATFISPPLAIGTAVVMEVFFQHERGRKMGIWALFVTLGPPCGPFVMGFVTYHIGWQWMYWIFAIINALQFILYLFLGPETRYMGHRPLGVSQTQVEYLHFRRIDPTPFTLFEFYQPILLVRYLTIMTPVVSYAMVFGFCSVMSTVEIPALLGPKFGFNSQEIGLQFLGVIIGTLTVFCVQLDRAPPMHWNVTFIIGIGIAAFGNQVITTVLITYCVDCHPDQSASIGVFVSLVRQFWGFLGPFWYPDMFATLGLRGSAGLMVSLIIAVAIIPVALLHWKGGSHHEQNED